MAKRTHGEGSVYKRKDGRYAAAAIHEGKRVTRYGKTEKEAWQALQQYLKDIEQGKVATGPKQTVKQYLEHWLENSRRLRIRSTTLGRYRVAVYKHIVPRFGYLSLSQLSREQVQTFYADLFDDGLAAGYIRNIHMVLNSALKEAVVNGLLLRNVCESVTLPRVGKYDAHVLTLEECKRLISAAKGHRLWFFILMAVTTGARRGELTALRWSDLDCGTGVVHIRRTAARVEGVGMVTNEPKTSHGLRNVRLARAVLDGMEDQKSYVSCVRSRAGDAWRENDLVFPNRIGEYMDAWIVLKQFERVLASAGLPNMHFHDLRHSAATLLLAAGVNVKVVQEILGHSDIRVTLGMYGHVLPDMQRDAVDKMNDMF